MSPTENLKKHIDTLEEKRLSIFFHIQNISSQLNGRLYNYNTVIGISALLVFLITMTIAGHDAYMLLWSKMLALITIIITSTHHLYILDKNANSLYKNMCKIYKSYDDEFVVLKKFSSGDIEENLIRQYYTDKSKELERYACNISTPGWLGWISTALFIASITLLFLSS